MKVGMAIITTGVREINPNVYKYKHPDTYLYINLDTEKRGPGPSRNRCLAHLEDQGCDYFFVFDDDYYPMMHGWEAYFIEWSKKTDIQFFGVPEIFKSDLLSVQDEVVRWSALIGGFTFHTKKALSVVGGYNEKYGRYGFTDPSHNNRVKRSGICGDPKLGLPSLMRAPAYIFSEDVFALNPTPTVPDEEKQFYIERNRAEFRRECASPQIFYPYR